VWRCGDLAVGRCGGEVVGRCGGEAVAVAVWVWRLNVPHSEFIMLVFRGKFS